MIDKLSIKNFQSHEHTEIAFCPNVNIIAGKSQSGKTAILRSLLWLVRNRPKGFRFHSYFSDKPTEVSLKVDNHTISLKKSEKIPARYKLDSNEYDKVGDQVPDMIEKVLNLTELNVQKQLDVPFLVTSSPGEIARTINKITKLEQVDDWVSQLTTKVNRTNVEIRVLGEQKEDIEIELKKYVDIDEVEKIVGDLEKADKEEKGLQGQYSVLDNYLVSIEEVKTKLKKLTPFLSAEKYILRIETISNQMGSLMNEEDLLDDFIGISEDIIKLEKFLDLIPIVKEAEQIAKEIQQLELQENLMEEIKNLNFVVSELEVDRDVLKEEYVLKLQELGKCPTCFSVIDKNRILSIAKEM